MLLWFLLEVCREARPPAVRLEGFLFPAVAGEVTIPSRRGGERFLRFNPTPRGGEHVSFLRTGYMVQPLEEGKAPTGSSPRGGEICLSTILPPAIGGGTGGIWRVQLTVGLVECPAVVLHCQIFVRSSSQVIRWLSASSRM